MTSEDSRLVLAQLVRSGIWSSLGQLFGPHQQLILDADSAVAYLYKHCQTSHLRRQRNLKAKNSTALSDYCAGTLVNYSEFSHHVEQMLDIFAAHSIRLHVVYRGKHMDAQLVGSVAAQVKRNTQQVAALLKEYPHRSPSGGKHLLEPAAHQLARPPNLALIVFKQIVNARLQSIKRQAAAGGKNQKTNLLGSLSTHQALYSPQPTLAKLARDFKCPVITNEPDFILLDVRAGFILFEDFFVTYLTASNTLARHPSTTSVSSTSSTYSTGFNVNGTNKNAQAAKQQHQPKSPKSPAAQQLTDTKSLFQQPARARARVRFHWHATFLRQHPGLNSPLAAQLFPLTTGEFLIAHGKSLARMHIYEREYREKDLILSLRFIPTKKYHAAAARLEQVCRFMCTKDLELYVSLVRGEAHRLAAAAAAAAAQNEQKPVVGSTFASDYSELINYFVVAHDFKTKLKSVLRERLSDAAQLAYIELCLVERECSPDWLLSAMCCSIGGMSSMCYNQSINCEDLQTKSSANSMVDSSRFTLANLLSKNKNNEPQSVALVLVDRVEGKLVERTIKINNQANAKSTRSPKGTNENKLTLANLARRHIAPDTRQEAIACLESAFRLKANSTSITSLDPPQLEQLIDKLVPPANNNQRHQVQHQLAIMLHLHRYSMQCAANDDTHFKQNYLKLGEHFELALINHVLYLHFKYNYQDTGSEGAAAAAAPFAQHNSQTMSATMAAVSALGHKVVQSPRQLIDLINKYDLENVANLEFHKEQRSDDAGTSEIAKSKVSSRYSKVAPALISQKSGKSAKSSNNTKASTSSSSSSSSRDFKNKTKQMRHLIELLNSSIEAYTELNAFLNYPLPQLNLSSAYNPILIFNLTLYSLEVANNTKLIRF